MLPPLAAKLTADIPRYLNVSKTTVPNIITIKTPKSVIINEFITTPLALLPC